MIGVLVLIFIAAAIGYISRVSKGLDYETPLDDDYEPETH